MRADDITSTFILTGIFAGALCLGCGGKEVDTADSATTRTATTQGPGADGTDATGGTDTTTTDGSETTTTTGEQTTTTTGETTTESGTDPFLMIPDISDVIECNPWDENCPEGQKCMPYANDGGSSWNALKCVDITGEGKPGEPCTVEGPLGSGMDDCQLHAMCWEVDSETNQGTCIAFCDGPFESPTCEPEKTWCQIHSEGILNICIPNCSPLIQDCEEGKGCYPINYGDHYKYTCYPPYVEFEDGLEGSPCVIDYACQPGLTCIAKSTYPGCDGDVGCCSKYCDLSAPDCVTPGTECVAFTENPQPGEENFGVCAIPE